MRWARRRHARARKQMRRVVEMYVQAIRDSNYAGAAAIEKLAPLEAFCRAVREGRLLLEDLPTKLRKRIVYAERETT